MSGGNRGQCQNGPPLELMHWAAAGYTVVGDKYGLFNVFFLFVFISVGEGGVLEKWWCVGLFPPCSTPLQYGGKQEPLLLGPTAACLPVCFVLGLLLWRARPGPQTDIHMCLYGPWDVSCAWSGLSHWPRRSPACWAKSKR